MPELPEVETVRLGIESYICGKSIDSAIVRRYDLRRSVPDDFGQRLCKKFIKSLSRRGKYIIFEFENDPSFVAVLHLGMSGRVHILSAREAVSYVPGKHEHILINMCDGGCLVYEDPRRFGAFFFLETSADEAGSWKMLPPFNVMGPEPLTEDWDGVALHNTLSGRSGAIKNALLDQGVVAGLGNIYVCEALHEAGISPLLAARDLPLAKCEVLAVCVRAVLERAILAGGSTLKDYRKTDGSLGYFQHSFRVYGKAGEKCSHGGCSGMIERIAQGGRSTFYCPVCQK